MTDLRSVRDDGAHFHRTDFQVHTPRDANWSGASAVTPDERETYAAEFVAACRQKALNAVAITDHHDFLFFPYIKRAAASEVDAEGVALSPEDRLVVFPGLELTLAVPCQALLVLDASFPEDKLGSVLEALAIAETPAEVDKLPPVTRIETIQSFESLYATLDARPWLKGRYTIFPNVTDGGHQTLMRSGMHGKYKNMPCVGGYLDGTVETKAKTTSNNSRIFAGLDPNWGSKRIALLQTSDARSRDFTQLGEPSSWVKWACPTAEALRQACLAQESRISQTSPALPAVYIASVHVSNSVFLGPIDLTFNRQYSAIIGGRGTGKSTILDYIRWCLGDVPTNQAIEDGEGSPDARRQRLIQQTLIRVGGQVEITFVINGIQHFVRRLAASGELFLKVGDGQLGAVGEEVIRSLLPVHAYSQKQLSSVAIRQDELSRFVTAPIQQLLKAKDDAIHDAANRLRQNYATLRRARSLAAEIERTRLNEQSLLDQAAHLRSQLSGLTDEDQSVLNQRPAVDGGREALADWERNAIDLLVGGEDVLGRMENFEQGLTATPDGLPFSLRGELVQARLHMVEAARALAMVLRPATESLRASLDERGSAGQAVSSARDTLAHLDGQYEDVKSRSAVHSQQLDQLTSVDEQRAEATAQLTALRTEAQSLGDPAASHAQLRQALVDLYAQRADVLNAQCAAITELSDGLLCAEVIRGQGLAAVDERLRALASGSNIRTSRFDGLFASLAVESAPLETWDLVLTELEQLALLDESAELTTELTPTISRLGLPIADQNRMRSKITVDTWLDLVLTPIEDRPVFRYRTKDSEYIPFESASAGQQATALLRVLLAQTGMPLIIDQPEEDLDSQVIQEVVEWLWKSKSRRQVIFASHNANLVVNGDAELVVACEYRRAGDQSGGRISHTGAIDVTAVRDEITRVMEGGEKAFRLRKDKYGF